MEKETKILAWIAVIAVAILAIAACTMAIAQICDNESEKDSHSHVVDELNKNGGTVYCISDCSSGSSSIKYTCVYVLSVSYYDNYGMYVSAKGYSTMTTTCNMYIPFENITYVLLNK